MCVFTFHPPPAQCIQLHAFSSTTSTAATTTFAASCLPSLSLSFSFSTRAHTRAHSEVTVRDSSEANHRPRANRSPSSPTLLACCINQSINQSITKRDTMAAGKRASAISNSRFEYDETHQLIFGKNNVWIQVCVGVVCV